MVLERVGQLGGAAYDVVVEGDRAYVGLGPTLWVVDLAVPDFPAVLGMSDMLRRDVQGLAVHAPHVYVALGDAGLTILDVADPALPRPIATIDTPVRAVDVALADDLALVADGGGVLVISITDPARPRTLGYLALGGQASDVAVQGRLAIVADGSLGLRVLDLADPAAPVLAGTLDTPGLASGVALDGTRAYVADAGAGLLVVDLADPANPRLLGRAETLLTGFGRVAARGRYIYLADGAPGVQVFDVLNPYLPQHLATIGTWPNVHGLALTGNRAWLVTIDGRLVGLEGPDPRMLATRADVALNFVLPEVAAGGGRVHVPVRTATETWIREPGSWTFDTADPARLRRLAEWRTSTPVRDQAASGSQLCLSYSENIQMYNPSRAVGHVRCLDTALGPNAPATHYPFRVGTWVLGLAAGSSHVYPLTNESDLFALPTGGIQWPSTYGLLRVARPSGAMAAAGTRVYLGQADAHDQAPHGISVVDAANPAALLRRGYVELAEAPRAIAADGSRAYVAVRDRNVDVGRTGLAVVDATDPDAPRALSYRLTSQAMDVAVAGQQVFLADGPGGLRVFDVVDPGQPAEVARYAPGPPALGVAAADGLVYLALGDGSLVLLRLRPEKAPERPSVTPTATAPVSPTASQEPTAPTPAPPTSTPAAPASATPTQSDIGRVWMPWTGVAR
jgi:hypothetical protein